jgi:hypothetical protein
MENFDVINKHGSVFLTKLYEPRDNALLLEVKKFMTSAAEVDVQVGDKFLSGCREVIIDECGTYLQYRLIAMFHIM